MSVFQDCHCKPCTDVSPVSLLNYGCSSFKDKANKEVEERESVRD